MCRCPTGVGKKHAGIGWKLLHPLSWLCLVFTSLTQLTGSRLPITVNNTRLYLGNERFFLSGANTAWVHYGADFGNNQYERSRQEFLYVLSNVSAAGGNSMRTWIHVDGRTTPSFDSSGYVVGLDHGGTFLAEFTRYLDDARARNILIFATLWNGALVNTRNERTVTGEECYEVTAYTYLGYNEMSLLRGLITNTSKLESYIDQALIPWVRAVKDHPAMGGWDIMNEMEGMVITGDSNPEPCFDTTVLDWSTAGFAGKLYHMEQLLRFINWQVDAIRRVDHRALVTTGSWRQWSQSDALGGRNFYKDTCLVRAGGRRQGTLTFYSTHVYAVLDFIFWPDAAFLHKMQDYTLDKPLVLAEFSQVGGAWLTITDQFKWAYQKGYSGAWSWMATGAGTGGSDTLETQVRGIGSLKGKNNQTEGGRIAIHINGSSSFSSCVLSWLLPRFISCFWQ